MALTIMWREPSQASNIEKHKNASRKHCNEVFKINAFIYSFEDGKTTENPEGAPSKT